MINSKFSMQSLCITCLVGLSLCLSSTAFAAVCFLPDQAGCEAAFGSGGGIINGKNGDGHYTQDCSDYTFTLTEANTKNQNGGYTCTPCPLDPAKVKCEPRVCPIGSHHEITSVAKCETIDDDAQDPTIKDFYTITQPAGWEVVDEGSYHGTEKCKMCIARTCADQKVGTSTSPSCSATAKALSRKL